MSMQLGFSTGVLYREPITLSDRIELIRDIGCTTLELGLVNYDSFWATDVDFLTSGVLAGFEHVSLHAPSFEYANEIHSRRIFDRIRWIDSLRKLDWVVFHPDAVIDFGIFEAADFNVAFENMDCRKETHKLPFDLVQVLQQDPRYGFVLDVNHIYSNDLTMQLATDFSEQLGARVTEIHLSGYREYHEPIHETQQVEILNAVKSYTVPIIIESVLTRNKLKAEYDYILQQLKGE